jgi:hypothetical protein
VVKACVGLAVPARPIGPWSLSTRGTSDALPTLSREALLLGYSSYLVG